MSETMTGGCLCRKIRYEVSQPLHNIIACHCTHCQKISGAGAAHNALVPTSALKITSGEPKVYVDTADSGNQLYRSFCPDCGSSLFSQRASMPDMRVLKVGTLDEPGDMKIVMNIWTQSARPWVAIDSQTEQYPKNRPIKTA